MTKLKRNFILGMIVIALAAITVGGCSNDSTLSEEAGNITLSIDVSQEASGVESFAAQAIPFADSAAVLVFRPTGAYETGAGGRIPQNGVVDISVGCRAENNKKVGVNLYYQGIMTYHGADEDVDVTPANVTGVTVDVLPFVVSNLAVNPQTVLVGQTFTLSWDGALAATAYLVEESLNGDFTGDNVVYEQLTVNTSIQLSRGAGKHYFRVAPVTPYALGTFTNPEICTVLIAATARR